MVIGEKSQLHEMTIGQKRADVWLQQLTLVLTNAWRIHLTAGPGVRPWIQVVGLLTCPMKRAS